MQIHVHRSINSEYNLNFCESQIGLNVFIFGKVALINYLTARFWLEIKLFMREIFLANWSIFQHEISKICFRVEILL